MGAAASSSTTPTLEGATAATDPHTLTTETAATPAKGDPQQQPAAAAASDPPTPTTETAAPPAKGDPQQQPAAAAGAADDAATGGASADAGGGGAADAAETVVLDASAAAGEAGEEEQGECGFCLFMKGGGCKEEFTAWEKCVEEAEAATGGVDVVERCQDITAALRKCMDAHADYYEPILRAERAMAADLEAFKAQEEAASDSAAPQSEEGQKKPSADAAAPTPSEEGQEKQAADAAAKTPSEESQEKPAAQAAVPENENREPAA